VFEHWAQNRPSTEVIGALFHHIRNFCDSTRPGLNLPLGLQKLGLSTGSDLLQEIAESEEDHGPHLAAMAGHILNRSAGRTICPDPFEKVAVEGKLKECSDALLGSLPGYDPKTGLMPQTRSAMAVFERRRRTDADSVYRSLGSAMALEMISYRHLIPGEIHCLVDSGLYHTSMEEPEMYYLLEHAGEAGAEAMHEHHALEAIGSVLNDSSEGLIAEGVDDFLNSLTALWDLLDTALLASGSRLRTGARSTTAEDTPERQAVKTYLIGLWQRILEKEVGPADDFFQLGGDSMGAIRMVLDIQSTYHVEIDVEEFFVEPSVDRLADIITHATSTVPRPELT